MKKKNSKLIWLILVLVVIFGVMIYISFKPTGSKGIDTSNIREVQVDIGTIEKTISGSGEVSSKITEQLELNTYRYFKEMVAEENQLVIKGEKILKYTNGTYLLAPYDLVIKSVLVPEKDAICRSNHYVEVMDINNLVLTLDIDEIDLASVKVGQDVVITVNNNDTKTYIGKVSKIDEIGTYASNGSKFKATIAFENDGTVKIGMSASSIITIDKAENVITVPVASIQRQGNSKYVVKVNKDKTTINVPVETGLSNDVYVEIKSGLQVGETVQMIVSSNNNSFNMRNSPMSGVRIGF